MKKGNSQLDQQKADLFFTNGKIITVDSDFSIAEAVAVKNGKIQAVGKNDALRELIGSKTIRIDLKGNTMLPGINDSHMHPSHFGTSLPPVGLNVGSEHVRSIAGIVEMVAEAVKHAEPGEWIHGDGWSDRFLDECINNKTRLPSKWDLDPVSPENPVILDGGASLSWVNSKALAVTGTTANSPPPIGNEMVKDPATGELTGLIKAMGKEPKFRGIVPKLTVKKKRQAILAAIRVLNELGVTSATDGSLGPGNSGLRYGISDGDVIGVYNDIYNEGELTLRVNAQYFFGKNGIPTLEGIKQFIPQMGVHTGFGDEWLRIAGIKLVADGGSAKKTAWRYNEYIGGGHGHLVIAGESDQERYNNLIEIIDYVHKHRFQVGVHANGDRTVDACVDGFIKAQASDPWDARHYTIHSESVTPECAKRMAENSIGANVLPGMKIKRLHLLKKTLDEETIAQAYPMRTLIDAGVHVTNSSDAPVEYPDWRHFFHLSVSRDIQGQFKTKGPLQVISREEAIRTFTIEGAWQTHQEDIKGSIEVGKLADFCILDEDILTVKTDKIPHINNLMTIIDGKIVYDCGQISY